ncbi:hypothetical protein AB4072_13900 [Microvirga sp. 2MCAF38]|uniref:hypothetical protein n=1 Tax=Microvirga sp. 2MCAF38 TaxID=3232989 RepID=UPI003F996B48
MRDNAPPDHPLSAGPNDTVMFVGDFLGGNHSSRARASSVYVVVHRENETWTHVYRAVEDARPGHILVFLEHVLQGDRMSEGQNWSLSKFGSPVNAGSPGPRIAA